MIFVADLFASIFIEVFDHFAGLDEANDIPHMGTLLYSSLFNGTFLNYYCRYTEKVKRIRRKEGKKGLLQNEIFCNSPAHSAYIHA